MSSRTIPVAQTSEERIQFLTTLPRLNVTELPSGDHCPICLTPFAAILEDGSSAPEERSGVTKLQCGHIFCMADISEWIQTSRGSCPTCRDLFLVIPELPDDESSDGGEYIPGSDSVADDMMDGEMWTDEDEEMWTDGEDMSFDEGITEGETDSSWERSSEGAVAVLDETGVPAAGQQVQSSPMDTAVISRGDEESSYAEPYGATGSLWGADIIQDLLFADDPNCEQIKTELIRWRTRIDHIQLRDWISCKEETRSTIHQGFCALTSLKPRIDAIDRHTSSNVSFVHYALATVQELHSEMKSKLEMIHDVDQYLSAQENRHQATEPRCDS